MAMSNAGPHVSRLSRRLVKERPELIVRRQQGFNAVEQFRIVRTLFRNERLSHAGICNSNGLSEDFLNDDGICIHRLSPGELQYHAESCRELARENAETEKISEFRRVL